MINRKEKRNIRHKRVRAKISGTVKVPRLYIFKSNKHIYAQLIDDEKGKTIISASDRELPAASASHKQAGKKSKLAHSVGQLIAKKAVAKKINKVVFDRGGYKYHGRVRALADGAREGGLKF